MKLKRIILAFFSTVLAVSAFAQLPLDADINRALNYQLTNYPKSQLADVYKNFFQDYFGPGHILANVDGAKAYINRELSEPRPFEGPLYEPTGAEGNFVRVNLSIIADSIISFDDFFNVFQTSMDGITPPQPDQWRKIWAKIDSVITSRNLSFENEQTDRAMIAERLRSGDFAVHHSDAYNNAYHFRYRIIARQLFNEKLLPLLSR